MGRPPKETEGNREELKARKKQILTDERDRIPVEGKFGNAKRKDSLSRVMGKLRLTAESIIHIGIIVLNLDTWLRQKRKELFCALIGGLWSILQWFWSQTETSRDLRLNEWELLQSQLKAAGGQASGRFF